MHNYNYLYIFGCLIFTVYGQLILKWRIIRYGHLPDSLTDKFIFLFKLFLDPFILSGFLAAFLAALFWMSALTKFQISFAYPFMSLSFILVFLLSIFLLGETFTVGKLLGLVFIIAGIVIMIKM